MQLFQRVKQISQEIVGSEAKLAEKIGLPQRKFNGYLNPISEKNLWQHLPLILEACPEVSREWLYFGEGEMLTPQGGWQTVAKPVPTAMVAGGPSEREAAQKREISILRELVDSKQSDLAKAEKIIALYERREEGFQTLATSGDAVPSAPNSDSVRLSATKDSSRELP